MAPHCQTHHKIRATGKQFLRRGRYQWMETRARRRSLTVDSIMDPI